MPPPLAEFYDASFVESLGCFYERLNVIKTQTSIEGPCGCLRGSPLKLPTPKVSR